MKPTDDEVVARLRASFQATAARTPMSPGRLAELTVVTDQRRSRPLVATMSAAAAVAALAAVAAVATNVGSSGDRTVLPASSGQSSASGSGAPSGEPSATTKPAECVPDNYAVIASQSQLDGLTYLLPSVPTGYHLYGAWGTISRNGCLGSATFYVEYDADVPGDGRQNIQVRVLRVGTGGNPNYPAPLPSDAQAVKVNGHPGHMIDLNGKGVRLVEWTANNVDLQLVAPMTNGSAASVLALADSLVAVAPADPRIKAPANCQVPPGSTCSSPSGMPKATGSPSPSVSPTGVAGAPIG